MFLEVLEVRRVLVDLGALHGARAGRGARELGIDAERHVPAAFQVHDDQVLVRRRGALAERDPRRPERAGGGQQQVAAVQYSTMRGSWSSAETTTRQASRGSFARASTLFHSP
jgi:hypothetical protein